MRQALLILAKSMILGRAALCCLPSASTWYLRTLGAGPDRAEPRGHMDHRCDSLVLYFGHLVHRFSALLRREGVTP